MGNIVDFPIRREENVKIFLKTASENQINTKDFQNLLDYAGKLENLLVQYEENIKLIEGQLDEIKEIQNHPIKNVLHNTQKDIKENYKKTKSGLAKLKDNIVNFCKKMVEKIKHAALSAVSKVASVMKIQESLEYISKCAAKNNDICGKAIKDIEDIGKEYHAVGRALKNIGRIVTGKEPINEPKENGKLVKALCKPYRLCKSISAKIEQQTYAAAKNLSDFHVTIQLKSKPQKESPIQQFARMEAKQNELQKAQVAKPKTKTNNLDI